MANALHSNFAVLRERGMADREDHMNIKNLKQPLAATALAFTFVTAWAAAGGAAPVPDDKSVKLSGCLIRGEGDGAGYLLTNTSAEPWLAPPGGQVTPSALGTSGDHATLFYWLDGSGDLKQHIGHRVEIAGDLKGDVKEGEITTERKDNWTEVTVKADGRMMKANVPNTSMFPAPTQTRTAKGLTFWCAESMSSTCGWSQHHATRGVAANAGILSGAPEASYSAEPPALCERTCARS